jgi:hypothetical protein
MSIPVDVAELDRALADFGAGYLLTVSVEGAAKVVTVEPTVADGLILVDRPGRGSLGNLAGNARVTLVFPPAQRHGFTLLVDGTAAVDGDDVRVTPTSAVLHRPAAHGDGPPAPGDSATGCGNDCHPVG